MNPHYSSYYWKMGKPYGREKTQADSPCSYKIIADPYYKRISIEQYVEGHFKQIIYDSLLLDFRHLKSPEQAAWQRETLSETENQTICLLRNQDDRTILIETLDFEENLCRACSIHSVHGIHLSRHRMYYQSLQDAFNGVILYDSAGRPVMMKTYQIDPLTAEFSDLLTEEWNMEQNPPLIKPHG